MARKHEGADTMVPVPRAILTAATGLCGCIPRRDLLERIKKETGLRYTSGWLSQVLSGYQKRCRLRVLRVIEAWLALPCPKGHQPPSVSYSLVTPEEYRNGMRSLAVARAVAMAAAHADGVMASDIAADWGITRQSVINILRKHGVAIRPRGGASHSRKVAR